ncbi:MAG: hypothetical protein HY074_11405 [Deltaproteobacteria bacterium]|nr:hypothetical protein [Deltaproteobacteria bacterium]
MRQILRNRHQAPGIELGYCASQLNSHPLAFRVERIIARGPAVRRKTSARPGPQDGVAQAHVLGCPLRLPILPVFDRMQVDQAQRRLKSFTLHGGCKIGHTFTERNTIPAGKTKRSAGRRKLGHGIDDMPVELGGVPDLTLESINHYRLRAGEHREI